ncbi:class I SAM-dependent methyltransferase [Sphingobium sp. PNB]|uniref:class I SAM-dependent methyltransferase n=1 Tax=Sphingobium sp. PNB TaxID=863934 RepID=UPI001CA437AC|nr:class I SAM-dependent methyltransferase [Sphingobium sp. PNB]MCB4862597.1 class I SAM-dependent methyltransferase [Sphingobium sp. PNB]
MNSIYSGYREEAYVSLREYYEPGYRERNNRLAQSITYKGDIEEFLSTFVKDPLTILDWGGDTGANTPFEKRRVSLDIFDISGKVVEGDARAVTREQATSSKYRLVICSQILEHIPFPLDVLLPVRETMDSESILYIEVPYEELMRTEIIEKEKKKRHWHEHVNFYSQSSMDALLENCGFDVLKRNILVTEVAGNQVHILQVACRLSWRL